MTLIRHLIFEKRRETLFLLFRTRFLWQSFDPAVPEMSWLRGWLGRFFHHSAGSAPSVWIDGEGRCQRRALTAELIFGSTARHQPGVCRLTWDSLHLCHSHFYRHTHKDRDRSPRRPDLWAHSYVDFRRRQITQLFWCYGDTLFLGCTRCLYNMHNLYPSKAMCEWGERWNTFHEWSWRSRHPQAKGYFYFFARNISIDTSIRISFLSISIPGYRVD